MTRGLDPIAMMKAVKNPVEIAGAREAHRRDGAAVTRFLAWFDREAPNGQLTEIGAVEALESFRRDTGLAQGRVVPEHLRRRAGRRHRALPGDARDRPQDRAERTVPDRLRRTVRGRHHRHHPHRRGRRADAGDARALHPGAQGPYRHRACGVSRRHRRLAARSVRAAGAVGARPRLRSRHRTRRRQLSVGARGPGAHLQARQHAAEARHDPVERARLLQSRRIRHPDREPGAGGGGRAGRGRREAAQRLRDADLGADRPPAGRAQAARRRRGGVARRLSRRGRADAVAAWSTTRRGAGSPPRPARSDRLKAPRVDDLAPNGCTTIRARPKPQSRGACSCC